MKTVKELRESFDPDSYNTNAYCNGYEKAIEGILKDIQESEVTSVSIIEKYLKTLLG